LTCVNCFADEAATIRVTNLSEDTRETDLQDLFRPFGSIARIFLAKDKVTGQSKVCLLMTHWHCGICIFVASMYYPVNHTGVVREIEHIFKW